MFLNQDAEPRRASSYSGVTFYDAGVIEKFADELYARASAIVVTYVLLGMLVGAGLGFAVRDQFRSDIAGGVAAAVVVAIAFVLGRQRASQLRLQAQVALCQVQIEKNTRRSK